MQRRSFLKGAGVVSVAVMGGGVWRASEQGVFSVGEGPAYEPWKDWRTDSGGGALGLVRAAILAASPHNTQPWLFKVENSSIELYIDTRRNVGALDPYLREEHIGMGCALENLMLASAANGYAATVRMVAGKLGPIPAGGPAKLLARVGLAAAPADRRPTTPLQPEAPEGQGEPNELYDAIPRRHTNRSPYHLEKAIPSAFVEDLSGLARGEAAVKILLFTEAAQRQKIAEISSAANDEIYADPGVQRGSDRWIRTQWSDVQKYRDGLTIDAAGMPPIATGIAKMMTPGMLRWAASRRSKNGYKELMLSAPLMGVIAVRDRYEQEQCLRAGRIWQRAHLLATARGVAARPCNESVEMMDRERLLAQPAMRAALLAEVLGDAAWQPTFVFYMGYPRWKARASPRRGVEDVVL